jgi:hypothetical protein
MKLFSTLLALPAVAFAATTTLSWDATYGNPSTSLTEVACSDGTNGLITRGFTTFGSLPNFPNIGGAPAVAGFNSPNCGTCWKVTYQGSKSINVLAIDVAPNGFNVAQAAMNTLTGGQAVQLGRVNVTFSQVAASNCGL